MHEHHQDDPQTLSEIEKLGYDPRDVPVEKTYIHAILLYVGCGVAMVAAWVLMSVFDRTQVGKPATIETRKSVPQQPYPLLQTNTTTKTDIHDLRHTEELKADTAGWIAKDKGIAHIPVDEAKKIVLADLNRPVAPPAPAEEGQ